MMSTLASRYVIIALTCILLLSIALNRQLFNSDQLQHKNLAHKDTSFNIYQVEKGILEQIQYANKTHYQELQEQYQRNSKDMATLLALQNFWKDSAKVLLPYYYYLGQEALLQKNVTQLNTAGMFFYENLHSITKPEVKKWFAYQAKELFEASLVLKPQSDSTKIYIGATLLFGEIGESPMQAVAMIKNVVERDSAFLFGQKMLGWASLVSGQMDKALYRFELVRKQNPTDIENLLLLGEILERTNRKKDAKAVYNDALRKIKTPNLIKQLQQKINEL